MTIIITIIQINIIIIIIIIVINIISSSNSIISITIIIIIISIKSGSPWEPAAAAGGSATPRWRRWWSSPWSRSALSCSSSYKTNCNMWLLCLTNHTKMLKTHKTQQTNKEKQPYTPHVQFTKRLGLASGSLFHRWYWAPRGEAVWGGEAHQAQLLRPMIQYKIIYLHII